MKKTLITNSWFYSDPPAIFKVLFIFIKGDFLILIPFLTVTAVAGLFSVNFMILALLLFAGFRFSGEMIYWLLQQFGPKTYRPYDFGLTKLDNNAIYILYQTLNLAGLTISTTLLLFFLTNRIGPGFL